MCVCCHPIYSGRQVCGRTSQGHTGGRSHRISPPSFCGACLYFSREKDLVDPFPRRPRSRILCTLYNDLIVLHLLGIFIYLFFVRNYPSSCDDTEIRTYVLTSDDTEIRTDVHYIPIIIIVGVRKERRFKIGLWRHLKRQHPLLELP